MVGLDGEAEHPIGLFPAQYLVAELCGQCFFYRLVREGHNCLFLILPY